MFSGKNRNGCFDCDNCPQTNDPTQKRFCVLWWEMIGQNKETGQQMTIRGCGARYLPKYLQDVCDSVKGAQAATESTRNEIARGLTGVARSIEAQYEGQQYVGYRNSDD